jgi:hypothetical protein
VNKGSRDDDAGSKLLEDGKDEMQLLGKSLLKENRSKDTESTGGKHGKE